MAKGKFSAEVEAWIRQTKARELAVIKASAQDVIRVMQTPVGAGGNMPVLSGFLRSSLTATLNTPATGYKVRSEGRSYEYAEAQVSLTINGMKLGDSLYAVYLANYAGYQEYGARGMPGRAFVRLAAQQWQSIVNKNTAKMKARMFR